MRFIEFLYYLLPFGVFVIVLLPFLIIFIVLIIKRIKEAQKEEFEKRKW